METINLGAKLAVGTQNILEQADDILGQDSAAQSSDRSISKYAAQPQNVSEGK
jgi:hypothetical protein